MKCPYAYYLIHSGPLLEIAKAYQKEYFVANETLLALLKKCGNIESFMVNECCVTKVRFKGAPLAGFSKPDRNGFCYPKKGSQWYQAYQEQKGCPEPVALIQDTLKWPDAVSYSGKGVEGGALLNPLKPCGIVWNEFQEFGLYLSDVRVVVADLERQGFEVQEPARSATMRFKGCRKINKSLFYSKFS